MCLEKKQEIESEQITWDQKNLFQETIQGGGCTKPNNI